jgi:hypothetical protein
MITIQRHILPNTDFCAWFATKAFSTMESPPTYPKSIYMRIEKGYRGAAGYAALEPEDPRILEGLQYAAQAAAGAFMVARAANTSVSFQLRDRTITLAGTGPQGALNPISWTHGVFAAVIARDAESLTSLCSSESVTAAHQAPVQMDPFVRPYARAVLAWASQRQDPSPHIAEARAHLPKQGRPHLVIRTLLELIEVESQGNYPELDGILGEALAGHRRYYDQGDNNADYRGWLAPGPLAVACRAADKGFRTKIRSAYMPHFIVEPVIV